MLPNILEYTRVHNKQLVLTGDINIDRLKTTLVNEMLEDELNSHNIKRFPLSVTQITYNTATSIDCICTNIAVNNIDTDITHQAIHIGQRVFLH